MKLLHKEVILITSNPILWEETFYQYVDLKQGFFNFPSNDKKYYYGKLKNKKFTVYKKSMEFGNPSYINSVSIPMFCNGSIKAIENTKLLIEFKVKWKLINLLYQTIGIIFGIGFLVLSIINYNIIEYYILALVGAGIGFGVIYYNRYTTKKYTEEFSNLIKNKLTQHNTENSK